MLLIPKGQDSQYRDNLIKHLDIPFSAKMYPFGITWRTDVRRLLPNFFLDLVLWKSTRHWPSHRIDRNRDTARAIRKISDSISFIIDSTCASDPARFGLSAGRDSRMLLACARKSLENIEFVSWMGDRNRIWQMIDVEVALHISRDFRLQHRILDFIPPTPEDLDFWLAEVGISTGEPNGWRHSATARQLLSGRSLILGNAGEVGRSFYWEADDLDGMCIEPVELAQRLGFPLLPESIQETSHWLATFEATPRTFALDMAYIEQRLGAWAGAMGWEPIASGRRVVQGFSSRAIFEQMLSLPEAYRWEQQLTKDIVESNWPELLKYPINTPISKLLSLTKSFFDIQKSVPGAWRVASTLEGLLSKFPPWS